MFKLNLKSKLLTGSNEFLVRLFALKIFSQGGEIVVIVNSCKKLKILAYFCKNLKILAKIENSCKNFEILAKILKILQMRGPKIAKNWHFLDNF